MEGVPFGNYFIACEFCLCIIGIVLNCWSAIKTWKTYNFKLAPYLIVFLGSCCNLVGITTNLISLLVIVLFQMATLFWCTTFVAQVSGAYFIGAIVLCLISVLR